VGSRNDIIQTTPVRRGRRRKEMRLEQHRVSYARVSSVKPLMSFRQRRL
jgi:hypothetical protein